MLYSGTDPESYITEYTSVYEDLGFVVHGVGLVQSSGIGVWGLGVVQG